MHPSYVMDFDTLLTGLRERVVAGTVKERAHPTVPHLSLFCYTEQAAYTKAWDDIVECARGIVLDTSARRVVARPFPKFFNYGEMGRFDLPNEPFEVFEKLDGSLAIVFHDGNEWRVATKGSFISEQAQWATAWLSERAFVGLLPENTYLFEIIYPENRIVIGYDFSGLVALAAFVTATGDELDTDDVHRIARALGTRAATAYHYESVEEIIDAVARFGSDREGFVVRFDYGLRLKIKGAEYLRVHRLVSRITPLGLWDAMQSGDDMLAIRAQVPDEFYGDFDAIHGILTARFDALVAEVEAERLRWADKSDKDLGLALDTIPEHIRRLVFPARKKGAAWALHEGTRKLMFKQFRPDGNRLEGYSTSNNLRRIAEES